MIIKVQNEAPFQVLTGAFTIGPSQTGYELQVGATSDNFTTLFSVGANTTRMVTNVANGSYYRLKNNVGEVSVNWSRTCVTPGGSGGAGNELTPVTEFPVGAEAGTVVALASGDTYGIYQYDGTDWNPAGGEVDLSAFWTSAETQSAITAVEDHLFDVEQVTASALTELHDGLLEVSGRTVDLSGYYTSGQTDAAISAATSLYTPTSGFSTINGSAITNGGDIVIQGGGDTQELQDQIDTLDEVVSAAIVQLNDTKVGSTDIKNIVKLTQAAYDALVQGGTVDPYTFYIITLV